MINRGDHLFKGRKQPWLARGSRWTVPALRDTFHATWFFLFHARSWQKRANSWGLAGCSGTARCPWVLPCALPLGRRRQQLQRSASPQANQTQLGAYLLKYRHSYGCRSLLGITANPPVKIFFGQQGMEGVHAHDKYLGQCAMFECL